MNKLRTLMVATAATLAVSSTAMAQESNPVTSNPPVDAIGRQSETSPGTPNRQNSAPGYRRNSYYGQYDYYEPSYGPSYGYYGYGYTEPSAIIVTPGFDD